MDTGYDVVPSDACKVSYQQLLVQLFRKGVTRLEIEAREEDIVNHVFNNVRTHGVRKLRTSAPGDYYRVLFFTRYIQVKKRADIKEIKVLKLYDF